MVETDAPFMAPDDPRTSHFMKGNEPCTLPIVIETLAAVYGVPPELLAAQTTRNAEAFFQLALQ
jgi:Tat protein secretion system quality control protein TatD with DNase activity